MRKDFILRCYIEKQGDLFVGVCIDLSLATQADTMKDVRAKLEEQIRDYLTEALTGDDKEHVADLLPRHAPFKYYLRFQYLRLLWKIARTYSALNHRPAPRGHATAFNELGSKLLASS